VTTLVPEWDLADRMRKALRQSPYNAIEMAEYFGVSRQAVSSWLNGKYYPNTATLRLWAQRTGVDFEWLCAARDSNPEPAD
jgi:transcriptional regulator with XRE-family HTH domain